MSTRWYPLYQKGNPQLRVFLPNFWLKLVAPKSEQPKNVAQFHCSMEMTKYDVKNYLEKIYNVNVVDVRTTIALGKTRQTRHGVLKDDDVKVAYVVMPTDEVFTFPDLFASKDSDEKERDQEEEMKSEIAKYIKTNKVPGTPTWFGV